MDTAHLEPGVDQVTVGAAVGPAKERFKPQLTFHIDSTSEPERIRVASVTCA